VQDDVLNSWNWQDESPLHEIRRTSCSVVGLIHDVLFYYSHCLVDYPWNKNTFHMFWKWDANHFFKPETATHTINRNYFHNIINICTLIICKYNKWLRSIVNEIQSKPLLEQQISQVIRLCEREVKENSLRFYMYFIWFDSLVHPNRRYRTWHSASSRCPYPDGPVVIVFVSLS